MANQALILVADDDVIMQELFADNLSGNYCVIAADSGEAALAMVERENPDIVLLDVEMSPGIDGYETCRRFKKMESMADIPVMFVSSRDSLEDRLKGYEAGGQDYLIKPFEPQELEAKIVNLLNAGIERNKLKEIVNSSNSKVMTALTDLADTGVSLNFIRSALKCCTLQTLATLTINSMGAFGIGCHVQLRTPTEILTITPQGRATPLEESVISLT